MAASPDWPMAHFGTAETPLPEVIAANDDFDLDDEELEVTPSDVVTMLGFNPKDVGWRDVRTLEEPRKDALSGHD